jgi:hypothetical protein
MTDLNFAASANGLFGKASGNGSGSFKSASKDESFFSNTTRNLKGHHLNKLSNGPVDISTGT